MRKRYPLRGLGANGVPDDLMKSMNRNRLGGGGRVRHVPNMTTNDTPTHASTPSSLARRLPRIGLAFSVVGTAAWALRYALQGTATVWTDTARIFYVADPDLGYVPTTDAWTWLGLEGLGATAGVAVGIGVMMWLSGRGGRLGSVASVLAVAGAVLGLAAPALPVAAFLGGMPPEGAVHVLPQGGAAAVPIEAGRGPTRMALPGGAWVPAAAADAHLVAAAITAGGETFDARFTGLEGAISLVPEDLGRSTLSLSVAAVSVKTGVPLRDTHAKDYLLAKEHPRISVSAKDLATRTEPDGVVTWEGEVDVGIMGRTLRRPATGVVKALDAEGRKRLGIAAAHALIVEARFEIPIKDTELDAQSFDAESIPLSARAVFVPAPDASPR